MTPDTAPLPYSLLWLQAGEFYYAAKAFDAMERLDPNPDYWEGKRGASIGVFQLVIAKKLPK
jgi:intraflagellar transport protein 56